MIHRSQSHRLPWFIVRRVLLSLIAICTFVVIATIASTPRAEANSLGLALSCLPRPILELSIPPGVTQGVETRGRNTEITSPDGTNIRFVGSKEFEVALKNGIHLQTHQTAITVDYHPRTHAVLVQISALPERTRSLPTIDITLSAEAARQLQIEALPMFERTEIKDKSLEVKGRVTLYLRQQVSIKAYSSRVLVEQNMMTKTTRLRIVPLFMR